MDEVSAGRVIAAMIDEYVTLSSKGNRPYSWGYGAAIVTAGMAAWGVDEESAAERVDEMVTDARMARGNG